MKLFYRESGSGPALVILHGLFGSSDNWTTVAKKLSDTFRVILPDQRNHGNSPHSPEHTYELMRDDLHELAEVLSLEKFFLAGHSMGGKAAISFALRWPEMLNGLCIADISPFKGDNKERAEYSFHRKILEAMLSMNLPAIKSREEAEEVLRSKDLPEYVRGFVLKNLKRTHDGFAWKPDPGALLQNLDNIMRPLERDKALSFQVTGFPVIFLRGEKSDYLPEEDYPDILRIFPAAEFITIENAGHWVHADNPDAVIRSIRQMIQ